jgi:hypothetical protein
MRKTLLDLKQNSRHSLEKLPEQLAKVTAPFFRPMTAAFGCQT